MHYPPLTPPVSAPMLFLRKIESCLVEKYNYCISSASFNSIFVSRFIAFLSIYYHRGIKTIIFVYGILAPVYELIYIW